MLDEVRNSESEALSCGLFLTITAGICSFEVPLAPGSYVIGRSRDADMRVEGADISRAHVRIVVADQVTLEDLGSANGTRVGGRRLMAHTKMLLQIGMTIELGDAVVRLRDGAAPDTERMLVLENDPTPVSQTRARGTVDSEVLGIASARITQRRSA